MTKIYRLKRVNVIATKEKFWLNIKKMQKFRKAKISQELLEKGNLLTGLLENWQWHIKVWKRVLYKK